jgi:hypothetical protein
MELVKLNYSLMTCKKYLGWSQRKPSSIVQEL